MESAKPTAPSAPELVRRVLEGLVERTLAFVHGVRVAVQVGPSADGVPQDVDGLTVTLTTLADRRPAVWAIPQSTWKAWTDVWRSTRREDAATSERSLMLLLTGGLDRWQLLADGPQALPGFPFPGRWDHADADGWLRLQANWQWYVVASPQGRAWVGLAPSLVKIGQRLLTEPTLRSQLREDVLGEACGRLGAERPWQPSQRGALELGDHFVLGPCLLPVLGTGEDALVPQFTRANPDAVTLGAQEWLIRHEFGWDGTTYEVLYRSRLPLERDTLVELAAALAGRVLPFAALAARPAGPEAWEVVQDVLTDSTSWLAVEAAHIPAGPRWEIFLPADLLNALASAGTRPWSWVWLTAGADNLLLVFLQINDRFRLAPPAGFGDRAGLDWSVGWYAQTGQDGPPPVSLTVSDLLHVAPPADRTRIVQNVLVPEAALQPLQGLFTWVEDDPATGPTPFQLAGFDRAGFRQLLAGPPRDAWDAGGLVVQTHEELRERNRAALEVIWRAWNQGRLELAVATSELLQVGYADVQKSWRERRARERTGRGLGPVLAELRDRKDLGGVLQRPGPRSLALALLYDNPASERIAQLCTKRFAEEFQEQQRLWRQTFEAAGPDLDMFEQALERIEAELQRAGGPPTH